MEIHDLTETQIEHRRASIAKRCKNFFIVTIRYSLFAFLSTISFAAVQDGYVVSVDSNTVYLDWGVSSGIKKGDSFQTYIPGTDLKHPVTGQVLGQTKKVTGAGFITDIQEKFSIGQITGRDNEGPKPGQRSVIQEAPPATAASSAPPAAGSVAGSVAILARELFRSQPFKGEANGMAIGDVDADKKNELIAVFRDRIEVLRWDGQKLVPLTVYKNNSDRGWVTVETADPQGLGKDLIFATNAPPYAGARGKTVVFSYQDGALKEIARGDGFVRRIDRMGGQSTLMWQGISMARQLRVLPPAHVVIDEKKVKSGELLKLPRNLSDDQLLGLTFGDWDNDGKEDLALLQGGERLRLFFHEAKWSAPETYGGTKSFVPMQDEAVAWIFPRLMTRQGPGATTQLVASRNIPKLGIRTTYMKFYDRSEIVALAWNGLEMAPVWRLPIEAYVADYDLGDMTGSGKPQLWVVTHAPGTKAIFLAFDIP